MKKDKAWLRQLEDIFAPDDETGEFPKVEMNEIYNHVAAPHEFERDELLSKLKRKGKLIMWYELIDPESGRNLYEKDVKTGALQHKFKSLADVPEFIHDPDDDTKRIEITPRHVKMFFQPTKPLHLT